MLQHDGQDGFVSVVFCSAGLGGQTRWLKLSTGEIVERDTSGRFVELRSLNMDLYRSSSGLIPAAHPDLDCLTSSRTKS